MKEIKNIKFEKERELYGQENLRLINCKFEGQEDGESHLKECKNIEVFDTLMALRYPLWHTSNVYLNNVTMADTCRAALWYSNDIKIENSHLLGIKALRECKNIEICNSEIFSPEFGWKCKEITCKNITLAGDYLFFESKRITLNNVKVEGKYNFQYVKNVVITNSIIESKDFFWHAEDVIIKDSIIKGEYLAWYSKNLTLINCFISGTQPFCYCNNLKLINCRMENTDLAFEYSSVEAEIHSHIDSIKNPLKGCIEVESVGEILLTDDSKYKSACKIIVKKEEKVYE